MPRCFIDQTVIVVWIKKTFFFPLSLFLLVSISSILPHVIFRSSNAAPLFVQLLFHCNWSQHHVSTHVQFTGILILICCYFACFLILFQEIPSTGMENWYKLEGRSQRSTIQGRIRLKLWLSTRQDLGASEEDNWTEIKQQEKLYCVFIDYELSRFKVHL